eukprot:Seg1627.5 transcript_id=Seg1627.5/GoldUCD/mRNA.D3Y31 product="Acetate kinase" protein_id=Seg1627.5/GoldUCD/D3Y31
MAAVFSNLGKLPSKFLLDFRASGYLRRLYNTTCRSILVLNPGSTSLKCSVYNKCDLKLDVFAPPFFNHEIKLTQENRENEISEFLERNINEFAEIQAVGLRTVHGGWYFKETTLVTKTVAQTLEDLVHLAPLHLPPLLTTLEIVCKLLPHTPCYVAFDTSFYAELPEHAKLYPLPYEMVEKGFVKYGFHGLNHRHCFDKISHLLDRIPSRLITCHLGGGASVSAIKDGLCIDTSMGYTPLDGIMMTTRCGSLDPSIVLRMVKEANGDVKEVEKILNRKSGVAGISGLPDLKEAVSQRKSNPRAELACKMFEYRLCKTIGAYVGALSGLDGLVFSGGIGQNDAELRQYVADQFAFLGIELNGGLNNINNDEDRIISTDESDVSVAIIHANEELVIAHDISCMTRESFDI